MDYKLFEQLCADLLRRANPDLRFENNFVRIPSGNRIVEPDIVGFSGDKIELVAEIKAYRSLAIPTDWLLRAARTTDFIGFDLGAKRRILMVAARLSALQRKLLPKALELIDFDSLYALAGGDEELVSRLDNLLGDAVETGSSDAVTPPRKGRGARKLEPFDSLVLNGLAESRGHELCLTLDATNPGRPEATKFERIVESCLIYIFDGQLTGWTRQPFLDDGLHVDIAAKIIGKHDFWRNLTRDFGTRFVLFECKNYASQISQMQVYSTEKYLFRPALRSVAIFVSPLGADKGALVAMKGAVRDSGKLMLSLTTADICVMLKAKDEGGEVHEILETTLDNMLLTVAR